MRFSIRLGLAVVLAASGVVPALAVPVAPSRASSEAEALALLDKSAAAYGGLQGASMRFVAHDEKNGQVISRETGIFSFEKSGGLRVTDLKGNFLGFAPADATRDARARKLALGLAMEHAPGGLSMPLHFLSQGLNPLRVEVAGAPSGWRNIRLLPGGGVAGTLNVIDNRHGGTYDIHHVFYPDPTDHLLRRVELKARITGRDFLSLTSLSEVQINPQFPPGTFSSKLGTARKKAASQ